ncbi:MFS family permease [Arthrobacter sp. CAN_A6]|uniref:MFS transporter n=1 Tax=Arthrobacter sp. CAN_A6 TaxID=2787721 RepID=UPI0018C91A9C
MYKTPDTPETAPVTSARKSRLGRFEVLPKLAGRSFLPIGLFARLPLAMLTVGALTLATSASGSYAVGGFAAGAVGIGSALGAPVLGFLADRLGQRPVLITAALLNTLAIALVVASTYSVPGFSGGALVLVLVSAFSMGFTCPQIGPLARVRWMALTRDRPASDLDTALSYESTADELTFVMGPALVGLLASLIAPWLPLTLAAVLTVVLVIAFAVHPTSALLEPGRRSVGGSNGTGQVPAVRWKLVALPVAGMVAMGTFFGSTQAALIAFAGQFGASTSAGLLYAVMGLSSAAAALSVAYWRQSFSHHRRWIASAGGMVALAALLFLPQTIASMLLVLFLLGIPVGPTMVTIFSIGSVVAPKHLMGTVMTLLASGIVAGTALGSSLAGLLADGADPTQALLVPLCAAFALLVLGLGSTRILRAEERPSGGLPSAEADG